MKAVKGFLKFLFTVILIILIFLIVVVCTYVLNSPDTASGTESRKMISGPWTEVPDKDGNNEDRYKILFDQGGDFQITYNGEKIADGWFKLDLKSKKFKLLMLPDHYTEEFAPYVRYKTLAEITYSELDFSLDSLERNKQHFKKGEEPSCKFLIKNMTDGGENVLVECIMKDYTIDLYNSEHDLTKNA